MPQMMPMWWTLYLLYSLTFLMIIISLMFFLYNSFPNFYSHLKLSKKNWSWKW